MNAYMAEMVQKKLKEIEMKKINLTKFITLLGETDISTQRIREISQDLINSSFDIEYLFQSVGADGIRGIRDSNTKGFVILLYHVN